MVTGRTQTAEDKSNGPDWTEWQKALMAESMSHMQRLSRLPGLVQRAQRVKKGATPSEVVYREDRVRLLHYVTDDLPRYKTPLVFCFALVNRPYILDLLPHKSVVKHFVDAGFDTYLIDWGAPSPADSRLTLEDHVDGYMNHIFEFLRKRTGQPQANLLGYCMGGTMSAMYAALYPEKVKSLILMAAGIDFSTREGLLNLWTDAENFDVDAFVDAFGNCPAQYLQSCFLLLKPVANLLEKPIGFYERLDDDQATDEFLTVETWLNDNITVPGETYRQFVKYLYQQNLLVQNRMPLGDRLVNLRDIVCPVLNLLANRDDLVPCSQSEPFTDLVGSADRKTMRLDTGHIGLAIGSRSHRELWPSAARWLVERNGD